MGALTLPLLAALGALLQVAAPPPVPTTVSTLYPWGRRAQGSGPARVRRAWVIPPIAVSENSRKIPYQLVQIKSDKQSKAVIYSIKGPGVDEEPRGIFTIDPDTGLVFLTSVLDREETSSYKIKAYAVGETGAPVEEPTDLEIIVIDQNDNRPAFQQPLFTGRVAEGAPPGTLVMRVSATDADDPQTDNAALGYSIVGGGRGIFRIDPVTGDIRIVGVGLDREDISVYNLTLQVADLGGDGLSTTATASIFIDDVNDNPPEFTQAEFRLAVPEGEGGVEVGRLSVTDRDEPGSPNWRVNFSISRGNERGAFRIQTDPRTNAAILLVQQGLDFEAAGEHELTVEARNWAPLTAVTPPASARVLITVTDVNEAPRFAQDPRLLSVGEGLPAGSVIMAVTAIDPDLPPQNVSYRLQYDPAVWLSVDARTGQVVLRQEIRRQSPFLQQYRYTALVTATDNGEPPRTATGTLEIQVTEVNDHPPQLHPRAAFVCSRAAGTGGVIVWATDADLDPQAKPFHFKLDPENSLVPHNWTIRPLNDTHARLAAPPDIGEGIYGVWIRVSDSGQPRLSREYGLNVTVCECRGAEACSPGLGAVTAARLGLSLAAWMVILSSALVLLSLLLLLLVTERFRRRHRKGLLAASDDDVRDNILNYDEQGGGEEDQDAFNIEELRNPGDALPLPRTRSGSKQPIRRDTPCARGQSRYPRSPPSDPSNIEDFINQGLHAADTDPNAPPYDTALIYDFEGEGSLAESLSSISSRGSDSDQEYDYLSDWGPRFKKLADMYSAA